MANGKSELGVIYLSEHNEEVLTKLIKKNGLIFEELFTAEPHVFISNRHPLAAKEKMQLERSEAISLFLLNGTRGTVILFTNVQKNF